MNLGEAALAWLYRDALRVDEEWSVIDPRGFTWWADRNAQRVEVVGVETNPAGQEAWFLRVQTDVLSDLELTNDAAMRINAFLMAGATLAGPVYNSDNRRLSLGAAVPIHAGNRQWCTPLLGLSALLQIGETRIVGSELAENLGATFATSGHPTNGSRPEPDELANIIPVMAAAGKAPSAWSMAEFEKVQEQVKSPPVLESSLTDSGLDVLFPYGDDFSLCSFTIDEPHPRCGNGLLVVQGFPLEGVVDPVGARLALYLNSAELGGRPHGYGLGSYCFQEAKLFFVCFVPNSAHRPGLVNNLYLGSLVRARHVSLVVTGNDWTDKTKRGRKKRAQATLEKLLKVVSP